MIDGFVRIATCTPNLKVANCSYNSREIILLAKEAFQNKAAVIVFPELCITGYTCGDLFLQSTLLNAAEAALKEICEQTQDISSLIIVGMPVRSAEYGTGLYNCGVVLQNGKILGVVPKQNLPNYSEFYEARHFTSGTNMKVHDVLLAEQAAPMGEMLFCCADNPEFCVGVEICEDGWVANTPSTKLALGSAVIICNLSASDEVIGKAQYRNQLVSMNSARLVCCYAYCSAGFGESTQDMVFSGHNIIAENGFVLSQSKRFSNGIIYADTDIQRLLSERRRMNTFVNGEPLRRVAFDFTPFSLEINRTFPKTPFVPANKDMLHSRCEEIITMQATGLATRLQHIGCKSVVLGLSGGLDSTLALIVCAHAFDMLTLDRSGIITVTMPCFGTTTRTKGNAHRLAAAYNATLMQIDIFDAVSQHFKDIGQNPNTHDVTYENSQARERTQILMDLANQKNAIVIGTGDLSELALGWATYNGDHMSMYAVNSSIPKTLVRYLTAYEAATCNNESLKAVLSDVLDTPVSPELLPPRDNEISQKTEDIVGPYELHDFFLYYLVRFGFSPKKIYRLSLLSFKDEYADKVILKWLKVFMRRFFSQQFKRSCLPDGPKVGTVTLSPRGDWRMPSDACADEWLAELDKI